MTVLLTDEEINYQIEYVFKHNDLPLEVVLRPLIQSSAKAQLKKVVEYLQHFEFFHDWGGEQAKEFRDIVVKALLKEVEE